ncbi:MAG: methylenetetrahydrofolate reductase [Oscillospiraceae bacterium]|nr:methylenetetrahydrofolate reductase [Oscillospiraceae bacterium]
MRITELFSRGEFVVTAEVSPPKGFELDALLGDAEKYLQGVSAINVTDCCSSKMRMGALAACKAMIDKGFSPIFQLACRDRNRIALQSDLLGAAYFGIENLLVLTGDHTIMGDTPQAKPVFDLDSVSLLYAVGQLEHGIDIAGNKLSGNFPRFTKGAVVSPCADSIDAQLFKMERKIKAGAEYFQTQGVFEPEKFVRFMEKAKQFSVPVMLGVIIPKSARMMNFLCDNIPGIGAIPEIIEELEKDKEKTASGVTGVEITARIIKECREYCQGVHIMALGWESKIPDVLRVSGLSS